jgi:uncharacterized protein (TIGR02646 family)
MRYIDIKRLEEFEDWPPGKLDKRNPEEKRRTPQEWRKRLSAAEAELRNPPSGKTRAQVIAKYSDLWSDVKDRYRELSHEKCWYCETKTDRMRGDIDHYRPKGAVTGTNHPGYWWLAFEWRNWRFACELCNSRLIDRTTGMVGGKGSHFPLLDAEIHRIKDKCDYEDYDDLLEEDPILLDPVEREDPELLIFRSDGRPSPATENENTDDYRRAKISIEIYHLNHSKLNRERRKIYYRVRDLVKDYRRYQSKWEREHDRSARALARKAMSELGDMITPGAEYSASARAYLMMHVKDNLELTKLYKMLTAS